MPPRSPKESDPPHRCAWVGGQDVRAPERVAHGWPVRGLKPHALWLVDSKCFACVVAECNVDEERFLACVRVEPWNVYNFFIRSAFSLWGRWLEAALRNRFLESMLTLAQSGAEVIAVLILGCSG